MFSCCISQLIIITTYLKMIILTTPQYHTQRIQKENNTGDLIARSNNVVPELTDPYPPHYLQLRPINGD